jgi:hypothetical protein
MGGLLERSARHGDTGMNSTSRLQRLSSSEEVHLAVLEEQIRSRLSGRIGRFRILLSEHGVKLRGYALSFHAKQLAQQAVMEAGIWPIEANEIQVYEARIPKLQPMR